MFVNDIFKKKQLDEGGPFRSTEPKKTRKGSVADLAAQKRKEQERGRQPIEPKDQMVGMAKVTKDVAEGSGVTKLNDYDTWLDRVDALGAEKHVQKNRTLIVAQSWDGEKVGEFDTSSNQGWVMTQGVAEGSAQDKLYKRHQELRKKSGLPDPDYYKELKASYDLPDQERYVKQKEIKQKYKVTNEDREQYIEELGRAGYEVITEKRMTCPECGGAAYEDKILAEKQDACYHKVKSRYKVWPSAYASGALVRCRKKGAKNWGNKSK